MNQFLIICITVCELLYDVGNWKDQLEHIYAHLINQCNVDSGFRSKIGQPKLGKVSKCYKVLCCYCLVVTVEDWYSTGTCLP